MALLLAFILSGVPATAVVCDLFLCVDPAGVAAEPCHAHAVAADGERMTPGQEDCDHLVAAGPYVASTRAVSIDPPAAIQGTAASVSAPTVEQHPGAPSTHAPPRLLRTPRDLPLRI
jgi:hypothetical protein